MVSASCRCPRRSSSSGYVNLAQLAGKLPASALEQVEPGCSSPACLSWSARARPSTSTSRSRNCACPRSAARSWSTTACCSSATARSPAGRIEKGAGLVQDAQRVPSFLISWGGAEVYLSNSTFTSFGYNASKAYGISISQYSPGMDKQMKRPRPEALGDRLDHRRQLVQLLLLRGRRSGGEGQHLPRQHVYGIDPHDRSHRLIIADNTVHRTRKKHGIIVSREVNDSFIFNNRSYENKLSGIVLDRNSEGNLVASRSIATIPTASPSTRAATTCSGATRSGQPPPRHPACATA